MTPESLLSLLRSHQDGVYTVCLHVLRNSHDAEDAAQEAMIKIASAARDLRDPRAFKSWLYRLVFRTAVDHARRRATRRRIEEGSVPMSPAPLTDEQRDAIHEAMAALPDDDRLMLVEHYFEKVPIVELGRREGISDVAMGKRLEKAREQLKRGLAGAGILLGATQVSHALESVTAATAPPGLVGSAIASKAALLAAGGAAVTKSTTTAVWAVVLVLLLSVGATLYFTKGAAALSKETRPVSKGGAAPSDAPGDGIRPGGSSSSSQRGDPQLCRGALARALGFIRTNDVHNFAFYFGWGDDTGSPVIDEFVRDFTAAAGDDLIPIAKAMLAEAQSDVLRFLMIVALGRSGNPAALELLQEQVRSGAGVEISAVAIHSIGLLRSPRGFAFLQSEWRRAMDDRKPLAPAVLGAIGRYGSEGLAFLLAEAKNSKFDVDLNHQGIPWSFSLSRGDCLAFARGPDVFEGLRKIIETEDDPKIREGAARAIAHNLGSGQVDFLAGLLSHAPDLKTTVIYTLVGAQHQRELWEATRSFRTQVADRILKDTPYPSGDAALDRALIRLGTIASPEKADPMFERFIALYPQMKNPELFWAVGEVIAANANRPDGKARITALVGSTELSDEQRTLVTWVAIQKAPPDVTSALVQPVLEILRTSNPSDQRFENSLQALMISKTNEEALSTTLQEVFDRLPGSNDRALLLRESSRRADRIRTSTIPRAFFIATLRKGEDAESILYPAYGLFATPDGIDPKLRSRLAEWIGRDMKWAAGTPALSYLPSVATPVIGDYYSQFGTPDDIPWLKDLPDTFPYPAAWKDWRNSVKYSLTQESRRAIDAIRLRN